jgi:glutaconate CoA-transferase subunit B
VLDFEPVSKRMRLRALQAGVTVSDVQQATGFSLLIHDDLEQVEPPTAEELAILRELNGVEQTTAVTVRS